MRRVLTRRLVRISAGSLSSPKCVRSRNYWQSRKIFPPASPPPAPPQNSRNLGWTRLIIFTGKALFNFFLLWLLGIYKLSKFYCEGTRRWIIWRCILVCIQKTCQPLFAVRVIGWLYWTCQLVCLALPISVTELRPSMLSRIQA